MTQQQALEVLKTGANIFLTGEPGSGKTHTINSYIRLLRQAKVKVGVTASTGIAATHLSGVTLHSWSGIGIKKKLTKYDIDRIASKQPVWKRIERSRVLIIDEVSMLEAQVLESVNRVCQEVKSNKQPFGGLQVIFVGDFFQLPPVTRDNEDPAQFAFESSAWGTASPLTCYLSEQYRQEDSTFLEILNALRRNKINAEHKKQLDRRLPVVVSPKQAEITRLFSHNVDVDAINLERLNQLPGAATVFTMSSHGKEFLVEQLKRSCLSPEKLSLKENARVMFTKNSPKKEFFNGTLGKVIGFSKNSRCPIIKTNNGQKVTAEPMEWTIEDNGRVLARVSQIPLRLAWAITIHKSQGMSLDAAQVDLAQAFEPGQGYVALSRVRAMSGLFLSGYNQQALEVHPEVLTKDAWFRQQSHEVNKLFSEMPKKNLRQMQDNFIRDAKS